MPQTTLEVKIPVDPYPTKLQIHIHDDLIPEEGQQPLLIPLDHQHIVTRSREHMVNPPEGNAVQCLDRQAFQVEPIDFIYLGWRKLVAPYRYLLPHERSGLISVLTALQPDDQTLAVGPTFGEPVWAMLRTKVPRLVSQNVVAWLGLREDLYPTPHSIKTRDAAQYQHPWPGSRLHQDSRDPPARITS